MEYLNCTNLEDALRDHTESPDDTTKETTSLYNMMLAETADEGNANRISRAAESLAFYKYAQLHEVGTINQNTITNFLTDLRHYCEIVDIDFEASFNISCDHYLAE